MKYMYGIPLPYCIIKYYTIYTLVVLIPLYHLLHWTMALSISSRALLALKCESKRELVIVGLAPHALVIDCSNVIDINSSKEFKNKAVISHVLIYLSDELQARV